MQDSSGGGYCHTIAAMAADAFIQCRVTPEIKALVRMLARREQRITESALIKQFLEVVLRSSAAAGFVLNWRRKRTPRDMRLYVRLDPNDRLLLNEASSGALDAFKATYVAVLVRSHLRNLTPLPKQELLALKRAPWRNLGQSARNPVNQIARAMNQGGRGCGSRSRVSCRGHVAGRERAAATAREGVAGGERKELGAGICRNGSLTYGWAYRSWISPPTRDGDPAIGISCRRQRLS